MKLYLTTAGYVGTQAEAKRFDKDFEQVEVPTDKDGLIKYLNGLHNAVQDKHDQLVAASPPPGVFEALVNYSEQTVALDEAVANAPLAQRLTWAAIAIEDARTALHPFNPVRRPWGKQPAEDAEDLV